MWQREVSSRLSWWGCQLSKVLIPCSRRSELWRQHGVWQAGPAPELARTGSQQRGQEDNITVIASYLAAPQLPMVATLQQADLCAVWRQ